MPPYAPPVRQLRVIAEVLAALGLVLGLFAPAASAAVKDGGDFYTPPANMADEVEIGRYTPTAIGSDWSPISSIASVRKNAPQ